jgi:hypothetical protein
MKDKLTDAEKKVLFDIARSRWELTKDLISSDRERYEYTTGYYHGWTDAIDDSDHKPDPGRYPSYEVGYQDGFADWISTHEN